MNTVFQANDNVEVFARCLTYTATISEHGQLPNPWEVDETHAKSATFRLEFLT